MTFLRVPSSVDYHMVPLERYVFNRCMLAWSGDWQDRWKFWFTEGRTDVA